jgi:hypothetical protein
MLVTRPSASPTTAQAPWGRPSGAAPSAAAPSTGAIAGGGGLIDRVAALVDRLAVQTSAARGAQPADGDVAAMIGGLFGIGSASSVDLSFEYRHGAASFSSSSADGAGAWSRDAGALDATAFTAHGTLTGDDGRQYAFTIDYAAVTMAVAHASGGRAAPRVEPVPVPAPTPVATIVGEFPTLVWSDTLLARVREMLGLTDVVAASLDAA